MGYWRWENLHSPIKALHCMTDPHNKILQRYFVFSVFFQLLLWVPVFYEAQRIAGLSDHQIFEIQSIYYFAFSLLEIPTGLISDRIGHKKTLVVGAVSLTIANFIPTFITTYSSFLVHFLMIALARSFISGAASAYIHIYLSKNEKSHLYRDVEGKSRSLSLITRILGWFAAGFLLEKNISFPYLASGVSSIIALVSAIYLPSLQTPSNASPYRKATPLAVIWKSLLTGNKLLGLMVQGMGLFIAMRVILVNLFQPLMLHYQLPVTYLGFVMGLLSLVEAIGNRTTKIMISKMAPEQCIRILTLLMAMICVMLVVDNLVIAISALALFAVSAGLAYPIQKQLVNDAIDNDEYRATLLSFESIFDRLGCALILIPIGPMIQSQSYPNALLITAIAITFLTFTPMLLALKRNVQR